MHTKFSRRRFHQLAASITASLATAPHLVAKNRSVNEQVQLAILGSGRGAHLATWFEKLPDSQVVAVCDPDESRGQTLREEIAKLNGNRPQFVQDFRRLLDSPDVDAIVIATPDHWHAPATIMACAAGKDVYVEKPASHTVSEGRQAVRAARHYGRIVQHGTQLRGLTHYHKAAQLLRDGVIGKPLLVKAINNQKRGRLGPSADEPVPQGVDYDLWLGPAAKRPFNRNRFHSSWHWMWDYGTGDLGNDGIHQVDIGRLLVGCKAPLAVSCSGAKLGSKGDDQETPDTMIVTWEYEDLLFVFEQRDFTPYRQQGHRLDNDNIVFGETGYLMIDREGYRVFYKDEKGPEFRTPYNDVPDFYQNFIDCVKKREASQLIADIEEGHLSALLCHLGNIAYRTGQRLVFDAEQEIFVGAPEANRLLSKDYRPGFQPPLIS